MIITPTRIKRIPEIVLTFLSVAGELRRCLTRSTIIERVRLPRNGKTAEIVQIATISSKVTRDKSKNPGRTPKVECFPSVSPTGFPLF